MKHDDSKFEETLFKTFASKLEIYKTGNSYFQNLPQNFEKVDDKTREDLNENIHPIKWLIKGFGGTQAFMIGVATKHTLAEKSLTEKDYYPQVLTSNFSDIGVEYLYCQVAIVIVEPNIDEKKLSWIKKWSDDTRYFRKIIVADFYKYEIQEIVTHILTKVIYPWHAIKVSENGIYSDHKYYEIEEGEQHE